MNTFPQTDVQNTATLSYVVPCGSGFRDKITDYCRYKRISVADLARSVLLLTPKELVDSFSDPGEPTDEDREIVTVQTGLYKGRLLKRKPRLQVRLEPGLDYATIRRSLALGVEFEQANEAMRVLPPAQTELLPSRNGNTTETETSKTNEDLLRTENTALRDLLQALVFEPLDHGVRNRMEALYVMGFSPSARPNTELVRERYRRLVKIHHPDSIYGNLQRMTQLNEAARMLLAHT